MFCQNNNRLQDSLLYIQPMSSVHLTKSQYLVLIFTLHCKCRGSAKKNERIITVKVRGVRKLGLHKGQNVYVFR